MRRRCPKLWQEHTWLLYHDNAPSHTSVLTQQFLANYIMAVIPHPPYSPDLAPFDFVLLLKMKLRLTECRFDTIEIQAFIASTLCAPLVFVFHRHLQGRLYRSVCAALSWEEPRTAQAKQSPLLARKESFGQEMADLIAPYRFDFQVIVRDF
jgi:hypothetical protein